MEAELTTLFRDFCFGVLFFPPFSSLGNPTRILLRAGPGNGGPLAPPAPRLSGSVGLSPGAKPGEEPAGDSPKAENESQPLHGSGICKWFNVRMGFGFLSMTAKGGATLDSPVDVFVHQVKGPDPEWGPGEVKGGAAAGTPLGEDARRDRGHPHRLHASSLFPSSQPDVPGLLGSLVFLERGGG